MKRLLLLGSLAALAFAATASAKPYGMAGCGLGSVLLGSDDGFVQVFAATTNGSSYSQSFGITTGTSNCMPAGKAAQLEEQQHFIANNLNTLYREMAQGQGQTLKAYSEVLGCNAQHFGQFTSATQQQFDRIFSAPGSLAVLEATKNVMREDKVLNSGCKALI